MWCFIREIEAGSYIVIPRGSKFYICKIETPPFYDQNKATVDAAYRRKVHWMMYKLAIPKTRASKALQDKMTVSRKCFDISELIEDVIYSLRTL